MTHKNDIFKGMQLILETYPEANLDMQMEHDQIWLCTDYGESITRMTPEQINQMDELGWFEDYGAWSHF